MTDHPYCENCRFFQPDTIYPDQNALKFGKCGNPAAQEPPSIDRFISENLDLPPTYKYAGVFRAHGDCGPAAKLFEPSEPEAVAA